MAPSPSPTPYQREHILLLGFGAIGRQVAEHLAPEIEEGTITLTAAVRDVDAHEERGDMGVYLVEAGSMGWRNAVSSARVLVEVAGVDAVKDFCPEVIEAGKDLVVASVGALADKDTREALLAGPGRLWVTNGAIGGFDLFETLANANMLENVRIRSSKAPRSLIQDWMSDEEKAQLENLSAGDEPLVIFQGTPDEAIEKFPANVNVSVALAWATRGLPEEDQTESDTMTESLRRVKVELVADPNITETKHEIHLDGEAGRYDFCFESTPSSSNPRTSSLTALSVVNTIRNAMASVAHETGTGPGGYHYAANGAE